MTRVGVWYATREGQTQRIAEHVGADLRNRGLIVDIRNVKDSGEPIDPSCYQAAVLAASVHAGRHEEEMVAFVKKNRGILEQMPTAFLSVTLSEAGVERPDVTPEERKNFADGVRMVIDKFLQDTGWHPTQVQAVAGALRYSKYNPLVRFIMKRIARKAGASTDTSTDHEYTNWVGLDEFAGQFATSMTKSPACGAG